MHLYGTCDASTHMSPRTDKNDIAFLKIPDMLSGLGAPEATSEHSRGYMQQSKAF